jgi:hypothetical protein
MRFEEAYAGWQEGRLRQEEAARLLGVCERSFRRYIDRYEEDGLQGLIDHRVGQVSQRRAPVDEVMALTRAYGARHEGWSAKHYYQWYRRAGGKRSYTWVKCELQKAHLVAKAPKRGAHRKRRDRAPLPGMLLHQDGSRHEWVADQRWDLIVTMDDATNEHYAMQFVEEEGTRSSLQGVETVIREHGLFSAFYSDRGSHYWLTPEAGGKVDRRSPTQFGRAMQQLGIEMIAAYSRKPGAAPSAPFALTRSGWCVSWRPPISATRTAVPGPLHRPGPANRGNSMLCRVISARGGLLGQRSRTSPRGPGTEQQKRTTYVLQNRTVLFATNRN